MISIIACTQFSEASLNTDPALDTSVFSTMEPLLRNKTCRHTSPYGLRRHPISGQMRMHGGCDVGGTPGGTPIYAPSDGIATPRGYRGGAGNVMRLKMSNGFSIELFHLSRWGKIGRVKKGTVIGYVGSTGYSTGPHMHMELFSPANKRINPLSKFNRKQLCNRNWKPNQVPEESVTADYKNGED